MNITVTDVTELPAQTFLSVRYGDKRQQAPFRRGEKFSFPSAPEKAYTVDVFRKVGSKQISLAGISALGGTIVSENIEIPSLDLQGLPVTASLTATVTKEAAKSDPASMKQQVAQRAKKYLDTHDIQPVLHEMFSRLLERLPSDPLGDMIGFLEQKREELEERESPERDFQNEPGMGEDPLPGFGDDVSAEVLPNLRAHHSLVADVLGEDLTIYPRLKSSRTSLGVSLAQCIKPGIDCPGHELVKVSGAYAGDGECYEVYRDLFDPIISSLHGGYAANARHPTDTSPVKISNAKIDPTGRYAVFATLETRRNLTGLRLPTCCSREERREVERIITGVLSTLSGEGKGSYYPLRGSQSYAPKLGGMTAHQEESMRRACTLFAEPDSRLRLSAGFGRHWPDARGIFVSDSQSFYVWCNEEDHVRFFSRQHNVDVKAMWSRVVDAVAKVEKGVEAEGRGWLRSDHLGFLASCPSRLGTGIRASVSLKIPLLAASVDMTALCKSLQLQSSQEVGSVTYGSVWNITNMDCLGISEVDVLNAVIEGTQALVMMEQRLERGEAIYDAVPGMGDECYPGFPADGCPARLPDLSGYHSLASIALKENPEIYTRMRTRKTSRGTGLAPCIKPGMDERGQANSADPAPGIVACDEECYSTFGDIFNVVIPRMHKSFSPDKSRHPLDSNPSKFSNAKIDPRGATAVSVRVELRRNFTGLKMPPCCDKAERRRAETIIVKALQGLGGAWQGGYMPLTWSESYAAKPMGMSVEEQAELRDEGLLFLEPTSPARLSMGLGRHWPDARGIYLSNRRDSFAWCNEEDHLCLTVKADGGDLKGIVTRAQEAVAAVEAEAEKTGSGYMKDEGLGYLTVNPANLGNGCSCAVSLRLAKFGQHAQFSATCRALELRAAWRGGAWEITNTPSLGVSQVDLITGVIEGCALLVKIEDKLNRGESIQDELSIVAGGMN
jgi:creatine kinase